MDDAIQAFRAIYYRRDGFALMARISLDDARIGILKARWLGFRHITRGKGRRGEGYLLILELRLPRLLPIAASRDAISILISPGRYAEASLTVYHAPSGGLD